MEKLRIYVGTYTMTRRGEGGKGIYSFDLDLLSGKLHPLSVFSDCTNPSFLAFYKDTLFACEELKGDSSLVALKRGEDGSLLFMDRVKTSEIDMCHLTVWPEGDLITASNFGSGSLLNCSMSQDGHLHEITEIIRHEGCGPHERMQKCAHVHSATLYPAKDKVLVCDLGSDTLTTYIRGEDASTLKVIQQIKTPSGAGPRHAAFSPDGTYVTVAAQLSNMFLTYKVTECGLGDLVSEISMLPDNNIKNSAADIHYSTDGRHIFGSNRGHDSIVVYDISSDGTLCNGRWFSSFGNGPRNFCITPDGKFMLIANQNSGNLAVARIDVETGDIIEKTDEMIIPEAVFVNFE